MPLAVAVSEDWEVLQHGVQPPAWCTAGFSKRRGTGEDVCEDSSRLRITRCYKWTSQGDETREEPVRTSPKPSQLVQNHPRFTEGNGVHSILTMYVDDLLLAVCAVSLDVSKFLAFVALYLL